MITPNRATEKISVQGITEFMKRNKLTNKDMAEISGYASGNSFGRAKRNGYLNPEAVFSLCQFFDLPRNYFEGAHEALGDEVILKERTTEKRPTTWEVPEEPEKTASEERIVIEPTEDQIAVLNLMRRLFSLDSDAEAFGIALAHWYDGYKTDRAERYKNLSKDELIAKLVERDLQG